MWFKCTCVHYVRRVRRWPYRARWSLTQNAFVRSNNNNTRILPRHRTFAEPALVFSGHLVNGKTHSRTYFKCISVSGKTLAQRTMHTAWAVFIYFLVSLRVNSVFEWILVRDICVTTCSASTLAKTETNRMKIHIHAKVFVKRIWAGKDVGGSECGMFSTRYKQLLPSSRPRVVFKPFAFITNLWKVIRVGWRIRVVRKTCKYYSVVKELLDFWL